MCAQTTHRWRLTPCLPPTHVLPCRLCSQPVVVAIASTSDAIQHYGGGIFDDFGACCTTADCQGDLNHAVTVVGYNRTEGYWLVRNSWGADWGENVSEKLLVNRSCS